MTDLADHIARKVFECPTGVGANEITRIALKGGGWPDKETDHGGLCEGALADVVRRALASYQANPHCDGGK